MQGSVTQGARGSVAARPSARRAARTHPAPVTRAAWTSSNGSAAHAAVEDRFSRWRANGRAAAPPAGRVAPSNGNGASYKQEQPAPAPAPEPEPEPEPRASHRRDPERQAQAALDGGLINDQFAAALSAALARSGGEAALIDDAARSFEEERASALKPVEEMLVTALHTSRATLRRLVERQSELEAEIAKEQKQASRLEWLLNRARADYAYFQALDNMNQERK